MDILRVVDAFCPRCGTVQRHDVMGADPGRCTCTECGNVQPMMVPLGSPDSA